MSDHMPAGNEHKTGFISIKTWIKIATFVVISFWLVWFFQFKIADFFGVSWNIGSAGSWGDTFGALNALFSALAFIGVMWSFYLQRSQLEDQRKEIYEQRERQALSDRTQNVQSFERTFFELLNLLREERKNLRFRYSQDILDSSYASRMSLSENMLEGTMAIRAAVREARFWLRRSDREGTLTRQVAANIYQRRIHDRYEGSLGPYFRLIYTIFRNIRDDEWMNVNERLRYARLIRSQLTSHEAALIGINALAPFSKDLSDLVIEYRVLKYVSGGTKGLLKNFYPKEAFEPRT